MRQTSDYLTAHQMNTLTLLKITQNKKQLDLLNEENIEHIVRMWHNDTTKAFLVPSGMVYTDCYHLHSPK
jgi:hypothetical protein